MLDDFNVGAYGVGFKYVKLRDYSRSYGSNSRPLGLFVWYPSLENQVDYKKFTDYFLLGPSCVNSEPLDSIVYNELQTLTGVSDSMDRVFACKSLVTLAKDNTPIENGKYPTCILPEMNLKYIRSPKVLNFRIQ